MSTPKKAAQELTLQKAQGETLDQTRAKAFLTPQLGAASTVLQYLGRDDLKLMPVIEQLTEQADRVHGGDLKRLEAMLTTQAHSLDAIFNTLAQRAASNMGQHLDATERYLRLALKAQGQCRATLETLATIKNPPVVFARQANISHGPQQVNNGTAPSFATNTRARTHAENKTSTNKLLEAEHGERLDTGATGAAIKDDPAMEAVEAVHRPKKRGR